MNKQEAVDIGWTAVVKCIQKRIGLHEAFLIIASNAIMLVLMLSQKHSIKERKTVRRKAVLLVEQSLRCFRICKDNETRSHAKAMRSCTLAIAYLYAALSLVGDIELSTHTQLDIEQLLQTMNAKESELLMRGHKKMREADASLDCAWQVS